MDAPSDKKRFAELIEALASAFGRKADKPMLLGYWMGLGGVPLQDIERAVTESLRTHANMPRPAELREMCGVLSTAKQAALAFTDVEKALQLCGYYKSPDFEDRAINATIRGLGGWQRVCELKEEEFSKWFRKEFERIYVIYADQGVSEEAGQPLVGYYEAQNRVTGHEHRARVEIPSCLPAAVKRERLAYQKPRSSVIEATNPIPRIELKRP